MLKKMTEYTYHYGIMVRIYPNTEQKQIISVNSNVSRFVYNKMVQLGNEISSFGKPSIYIKVVNDRLTYLKELKKSTTVLKDTYPWLCDKRIDSLAIASAKQNYSKAWNLYQKVYNISPPNYHKRAMKKNIKQMHNIIKRKLIYQLWIMVHVDFLKNILYYHVLVRLDTKVLLRCCRNYLI